MINPRNILTDYFSILEEKGTVKYLQCKFIPISFDASASTEELWKKHDAALQKLNLKDVQPKQSLLDLKIELVNRIFENCHLCERRCGVDRRKVSGDCVVKESKISSEFLHIGEERVLVPSYTVFFSGCTFHCVFCQNWDISQNYNGTLVKPEILAIAIQKRKQQGAKNVNWVGGDPTSNLPYILKVLNECEENIPQVWNSNMYCSTETMKLLNGVMDVYLTDLKYGNDDCAKRLSKVDNYTRIVQRNHQIAYKQGELIIRHLVMPNHTTCCSEPILQWISKNIPNVLVNIMAQYRPEYKAYDHKDISRPISTEEYQQVKQTAEKLRINET